MASSQADPAQSNQNEKNRIMVVASNEVPASGAMKFITLPHPKTATPQAFTIVGTKILEVQKLATETRSWLVDQSVQKDGAMYTATQYDPLFLVLNVLEQARNKTEEHEGRFQELETALENSPLPVATLLTLDGMKPSVICDTKTIGDYTYYRLSCEKTLKWLRNKVTRVQNHLHPNADQDGSFFGSSETERLVQCVSIIGDYLCQSWLDKLITSFGLTAADFTKKRVIADPELPAVKSPNGEASASGTPQTQPKKKAKTAPVAKASKFEKSDIKGMRALSSFFGAPKPKATAK